MRARLVALSVSLVALAGCAGPAQPVASSAPPVPRVGSASPNADLAWTRLRIERLADGPVSVSAVAEWSRGYLALGQPGATPLTAWASSDGRTWTALPARTFPATSGAAVARCGAAVVVAIETDTGATTVWHSTDGSRWTSERWPRMGLARGVSVAGSRRGCVGILGAAPPALSFSSDGVAWQPVPLPGNRASRVFAVAAFQGGFVAVGDAGTDASGTTNGSPVGWWSADGMHWTQAAVAAHPGDGFDTAVAGDRGLIALSHSVGYVPGLSSFWTSPDGRRWALSSANPLGVTGEGEGMGSVNGAFSGDGTRLLAYGTRGPDQPTEYFTSSDAVNWTKVVLEMDPAAPIDRPTAPFLLSDGVLFSSDQGAWFGTPSVR